MKFFGLELKQDIEDLKKDIAHQVAILNTELSSKIDVNSANNNHIHVTTGAPSPPKDEDLPGIQSRLEELSQKFGSIFDETEKRFETESFFIKKTDDNALNLFATRLAFEKLLNTYAWTSGATMPRRAPLHRQLALAAKEHDLPKELHAGIRDIIAICNEGIHGESISSAKLDFVKTTAPELYHALQNALNT